MRKSPPHLSDFSQRNLVVSGILQWGSDYSGDLNNKHLNKEYIWITNFHLFPIQMPANSSLFKLWPEYQTKSSLFKPSVTKPFSQAPYDLNNELLVRYSGRGLKNKQFNERTVLGLLYTILVVSCFRVLVFFYVLKKTQTLKH